MFKQIAPKLFLFFLLNSIFLPFTSLSQNDFTLEYVKPEIKAQNEVKWDSLSQFLSEAGSSSVIILKAGKILYEWGDTNKKHTIHSIRKTLLNSLYGIYIDNGVIDTTSTLAQLKIDDLNPKLTEIEKTATIGDLLKSRSGIYHSSAATSPGMLANMPKRGAYKPGDAYIYNNWDFNVLGYILEKQTGEPIYDLFYKHIAKPLGMDYEGTYTTISEKVNTIPKLDGFYQFEYDKSQYPAYHFRLSAKDLALYGQLYLNKGQWNGNQIIPAKWIDASTKPYSVTNESYGIAYGMLWNVLMKTDTRPTRSFYHTGVGVHMLGVYPNSEIVLVHRVDTETEYNFNQNDFYKMIDLVWNAIAL